MAIRSTIHPAHDLVARLAVAWTDEAAARAQSKIIVRELYRAGMLAGAATMTADYVIEADDHPPWWGTITTGGMFDG